MKTLPEITRTIPAIAQSEAAFDDALFTGPQTFDGYIVRRFKNSVRVWYKGDTYFLNGRGVLCAESTLTNGKRWYSYCGLPIAIRESIIAQVKA